MQNKLELNRILNRINLATVSILIILIISSLLIPFENSWKYLPVFKYHLAETDKSIEIFVHGFLFDFNLGFFFQSFVLIFTLMIYFATYKNISFQLLYSVLIVRSVLILIQDTSLSSPYILNDTGKSVYMVQILYILFFTVLFIFGKILEPKKRLHPDSYRDGAI